MTTADVLLAELRALGARVTLRGDKVRVEVPPGRVTSAMREAITDHKAELIAALTAASTPAADRRLDLADCLELLEAMHAEIRVTYVEGAFPWALANLPELARRFHDTEAAIDRLAGTRPTEADLRRALAAHAAVWRELVARYRAQQERPPCPHATDPELQDWCRDHPELTCARCFHNGDPLR